MDYEISIRKLLTRVAKGIVEEQEKKGIRASGESAKSLSITADAKRGELKGRAYFEQQEKGRGPTKKGKKPGVLRGRILAWLKIKPWSRGLPAKKQVSLSYAITRKIHERGTLRGRTEKYPGLGLSAIYEKNRTRFIIDIAKNNMKAFSKIFDILKK